MSSALKISASDRVGDLADGVVGQLGAQRPLQRMANVADRHPTRIQADNHLVQAAEAPLPLRDQPRLERATRSRGVSIPTEPTSVDTVFGIEPFREFGEPRPAASPLS